MKIKNKYGKQVLHKHCFFERFITYVNCYYLIKHCSALSVISSNPQPVSKHIDELKTNADNTPLIY